MRPKTAAYALRLPASLKEEAERLAAQEGSSLNQFIVNAVAEKVSALGGAGDASRQDRMAGASEARPSVGDDEETREEA